MRRICFATGNLYRLIGKCDVMDLISRLDIDGVEYTYGKTLAERPLREKDFDILNNYSQVSFHSPFRFSRFELSKNEFKSQFHKIESDYFRVNAKGLVTHPTQVLDKIPSKINFLTENLNPKKSKPRPRLGFEKVLNANPDYGLCLDVNHAYDWSKVETARIVKKWSNRIKQIHLSNNRFGKDHLTFEKINKSFIKSIEPILELDVPIIIEEDMHYTKITEIKAEVKRVKEILGF
ncbi:MAG: hypothetical protein WCI04_01565 [archaeon]